jgi:hypothetical protein
MDTTLILTPAQMYEIGRMADICSLPADVALAYIRQIEPLMVELARGKLEWTPEKCEILAGWVAKPSESTEKDAEEANRAEEAEEATMPADPLGQFRALVESLPVVEVLALGQPGDPERAQLELFALPSEAMRLEWADWPDVPQGVQQVGRMLVILPHHVAWEGRLTFWHSSEKPTQACSTHSATGEGLNVRSGLDFEDDSALDTVVYPDRFVQTRLARDRLCAPEADDSWDDCSDSPA